jgi:hypothetical protein
VGFIGSIGTVQFHALSTWVSSLQSAPHGSRRVQDGFHRFNLHCHTEVHRGLATVYWRKLKLEAKLESSSSYFSFKHLVPGAFNVCLIGSTCTALPLA